MDKVDEDRCLVAEQELQVLNKLRADVFRVLYLRQVGGMESRDGAFVLSLYTSDYLSFSHRWSLSSVVNECDKSAKDSGEDSSSLIIVMAD